MTTLEAHGHFAAFTKKQRAEIAPITPQVKCPGGWADAWPAVTTAAVILTGWLSGCDSREDLIEAVREYGRLFSAGTITLAELEKEATGVLDTLMWWGDLQEKAAAAPYN